MNNGSGSTHTSTSSTSTAIRSSKTATTSLSIPKNGCYSKICSNRLCSESFSSSSISSDTTQPPTQYAPSMSTLISFYSKWESDPQKLKWPYPGTSEMIKIKIRKREIKLWKSSFLISRKLHFPKSKLSRKELPSIPICKLPSESYKK